MGSNEREEGGVSAELGRDYARYDIERAQGWREWCRKMPYISFPRGWQIKPIPPFAGALARFMVRLPDGREKSVYFDGYEALGYFGEPYWEVHPVGDDVGRCKMDDVDELLRLIKAK